MVIYSFQRLLFKPLNNTLVNPSKLVYQISSGGRLAMVDMANDDNADVNLPLTYYEF